MLFVKLRQREDSEKYHLELDTSRLHIDLVFNGSTVDLIAEQ